MEVRMDMVMEMGMGMGMEMVMVMEMEMGIGMELEMEMGIGMELEMEMEIVDLSVVSYIFVAHHRQQLHNGKVRILQYHYIGANTGGSSRLFNCMNMRHLSRNDKDKAK